eukprot:364439-Chlamydomonas_euryale.AAC.9
MCANTLDARQVTDLRLDAHVTHRDSGGGDVSRDCSAALDVGLRPTEKESAASRLPEWTGLLCLPPLQCYSSSCCRCSLLLARGRARS